MSSQRWVSATITPALFTRISTSRIRLMPHCPVSLSVSVREFKALAVRQVLAVINVEEVSRHGQSLAHHRVSERQLTTKADEVTYQNIVLKCFASTNGSFNTSP